MLTIALYQDLIHSKGLASLSEVRIVEVEGMAKIFFSFAACLVELVHIT
jgi:hypothetical protein